jgi:repressor LexA
METVEEVIDLEEMFGKNKPYVLRVRGDTMIEDGIFDGDYVVVERRPDTAIDGQHAVVLLDTGECTLTRVRFLDDADNPIASAKATRIRLEPANAKYEAKVYPRDRARIQGVVIGVLRSYA